MLTVLSWIGCINFHAYMILHEARFVKSDGIGYDIKVHRLSLLNVLNKHEPLSPQLCPFIRPVSNTPDSHRDNSILVLVLIRAPAVREASRA